MMPNLKLWEARCDFTDAICELKKWANLNLIGYRIAFGEGLVSITDASDGDYDGPHLKGGGHYNGVAMDLLVYDDGGRYISDGEHKTYQMLGYHWRTLHYLARWGGDFGDPNHFSFEWNGKK